MEKMGEVFYEPSEPVQYRKEGDFMDSTLVNKITSLVKEPQLEGYRIGLAGSFVREEETPESDIDIVVDTDALTFDQMNFIHEYFDRDVDIIQLRLLAEEDKSLDEFCVREGFPINDDSAYKSICREVMWFG